jgi:hypothetical protein
LAPVDVFGRPLVVPVTFRHNRERGAIGVGWGIDSEAYGPNVRSVCG